MGSSSDIDLSLANIYKAWQLFRAGKRLSYDIEWFQYDLEANLLDLAGDLQKGRYVHGSYRHFEVQDNKRRNIAVASVRDRVVHRLLYEYLLPIWDPHFSYDCWSCRPGKGLLGAISRAQYFTTRYDRSWLWRSDIAKFFDHVDHDVLVRCLKMRVKDENVLILLNNLIDSYSTIRMHTGIPIGNLTSQIFANIYLNEFDRFVQHSLKPLGYLRYGDDFVLWCLNIKQATEMFCKGGVFLADQLGLRLHDINNILQPSANKLHFLGVEIWPRGHRLDKRMRVRINQRVSATNIASYEALLKHHGSDKAKKLLTWDKLALLDIL